MRQLCGPRFLHTLSGHSGETRRPSGEETLDSNLWATRVRYLGLMVTRTILKDESTRINCSR